MTAAWRDPTCYGSDITVAPYQQVVDSPAHRSKFPAVSEDGQVTMINRGPYSYFRDRPMQETHVRAAGGATRVIRSSDSNIALDSRLVRFGGDDYILWFGHDRQHLVRLPRPLNDGAAEHRVTLHYPEEDRVEKNWAPYVDGGRLHFITRMRPMRVVVCDDPSTGQCRLVHDEQPSWKWDPAYACVRGSSPLVPTRHPDTFVGLAHTAGGANSQHRWNQLVSYRILVVLYDARQHRLVAVSDPLDLAPIYPCLGLRPRDYVRVHFATQLHSPDATVARPLDGDWLASVDLFDSRGLLVRLRGLDQWIDRGVAGSPVDMQDVSDRLNGWMDRRLGGLNLVSNWFNLLKSAAFRRTCGAGIEI